MCLCVIYNSICPLHQTKTVHLFLILISLCHLHKARGKTSPSASLRSFLLLSKITLFRSEGLIISIRMLSIFLLSSMTKRSSFKIKWEPLLPTMSSTIKIGWSLWTRWVYSQGFQVPAIHHTLRVCLYWIFLIMGFEMSCMAHISLTLFKMA